VKYGDIVYTKSPTGDFPYGIVKRSYIKNAVAVSPLYGVYKPINDNIGVFLHFYFMQSNNAFNYLHPLIQKGAKNTINITNARFLENSIPLPKTEDEVVYIANALTSIQTKIDIEKSLLCSYEKEKQYLLCQMFI
ncbi:restriction endonuclease subunit S, partial [Phocaeicola sp.]|uniref:restriction endonuclease subunit S n=1 Tax=Phocaeicola sp. TaxID=2773926 RepID=UPI00307C40D0